MTWQTYRLGSTVLKAAEPLRLWETEKGLVQTSKDTLAIPVVQDDSVEGYVLHGHGKLVLDMIVDTDEGAVGRSVEKEINLPFLMLGNTEKIRHCLKPAGQEDFSEMGYVKQEEFLAKAEDLLNRFSRGRRIHDSRCRSEGSVFAFQNKAEKLDILVAKGAELAYRTLGTVFVSNGDKAVLKNPGVVCISNGKSIIVKM
jgi:hypothetical protein